MVIAPSAVPPPETVPHALLFADTVIVRDSTATTTSSNVQVAAAPTAASPNMKYPPCDCTFSFFT